MAAPAPSYSMNCANRAGCARNAAISARCSSAVLWGQSSCRRASHPGSLMSLHAVAIALSGLLFAALLDDQLARVDVVADQDGLVAGEPEDELLRALSLD